MLFFFVYIYAAWNKQMVFAVDAEFERNFSGANFKINPGDDTA
jgi:hypothetical protein